MDGPDQWPVCVEYNDSFEYGYYDFNYTNMSCIPEDFDEIATTKYEEYLAILRDREMFVYFYHTFAALIFLSNLLLIVAILVSRKQRRHFRNWLILNMAFANMLIGGIICPFLGQKLVEQNAGLDTVGCKLLSFLTDALSYMTNVSIAILGVYQFLYLCSSRLLNGVSHALLMSIMIVTPWVVVVMMTVVLRLSMSEEVRGQCYIISHTTTNIVWLTLSNVAPMLLSLLTLTGILTAVCFSVSLPSMDSPGSGGRRNITVFVCVCLTANLLMQAPHSFMHSHIIAPQCTKSFGYLVCSRLIYSLDMIRLFSMLLIPAVFLIPGEVKRFYKRMRKIITKSVDYSSKNSCKAQQLELKTVKSGERSLIGTG